jgi:acyl carrier protein
MPPLTEEIERHVRLFLSESAPTKAAELAQLPLYASVWDVADSLSMLSLLDYLEKKFQFHTNPVDFVPENFGSIGAIVQFVAERAGT